MDEDSLEGVGIDWAVNVKSPVQGRVEGTVQSPKAKFLVLIHSLPDEPYVSVSKDRGETWETIPNNKEWAVTARGFVRWRIDAPGEGVWLLIELILPGAGD